MSRGIECICIDDTNKPKEIPQNKWVVKDSKYTITHIFKHPNQNNIQGVELAEVDISKCKPYETFRLSRFAISIDDMEKFMQLMKDCTDLNDIEIDSFVKELIEKEYLILGLKTHE